MIQLVYAYCPHGNHFGITVNGKGRLPWAHCPKDLENFKNVTQGTSLLMGAKTWQSLPGVLPGRPHIVLCNPDKPVPILEGRVMLHTPEMVLDPSHLIDFLEHHKDSDAIISVICGISLLETAFPYASKVFQTRISSIHPMKSDVKLPETLDKLENFKLVEHKISMDDIHTIAFNEFERKL